MSMSDQSSFDEDLGPDDEAISKSEKKRQMLSVQALGESLVELSEDQLKKFSLDERLYDAVLQAKQIRSREALRRQKQYIGKLMRKTDVEPIRAKMEALENHRSLETAGFHEIEVMRTQLLAEGKEAIGEVIERFPHIDTQKLRQLVKKAKKEQTSEQGMNAQRALFRFLRQAQLQAPQHDEPSW